MDMLRTDIKKLEQVVQTNGLIADIKTHLESIHEHCGRLLHQYRNHTTIGTKLKSIKHNVKITKHNLADKGYHQQNILDTIKMDLQTIAQINSIIQAEPVAS